MSDSTPLTISVPEAGKKYFGLCRNASYDAASRGEIPTIKVGRLLRVPVRALERMLDRAESSTLSRAADNESGASVITAAAATVP
jgi:hypothetical protein